MSDSFRKDVYRPIGPAAWKKLVEQAAGSPKEGEEPRKIETSEITEALKVTISTHSLTRLESMRRAKKRDEVIDWASELTGLPRDEIDLEKADFEHAAQIITQMQAVDIIACLDWDECSGIEFGDEAPEWFVLDGDPWTATENPLDWMSAKDWFFTACLELAWEANPQMALGAGQIPFA